MSSHTKARNDSSPTREKYGKYFSRERILQDSIEKYEKVKGVHNLRTILAKEAHGIIFIDQDFLGRRL